MMEKENKCLGKKRFMVDNNVLYADEHKHLLAVRLNVMHLAHNLSWAGHLCCYKTHMEVSACFY